MGQRKVVCSLLLLGLLYLSAGQEVTTNSTICKVHAYHDGNGNFRLETTSSVIPAGTHSRKYPACCAGYVYRETPECDPECPSGSCVFGYCPDDEKVNCGCYDDDTYPADPDIDCIPACHQSEGTECSCHAGYTKDERTNLCVPTECFGRCTNGHCDQMGICTCQEGYVKHTNKTGLCVPQKCDDDCLRGWCSSDGTCNCHEGFKHLDKMTCERIICPSFDTDEAVYCKAQCDSTCKNGHCTDEGTCICDTGYKNPGDSGFSCEKVTCPASEIQDIEFCKSKCDAKCNDFGSCTFEGSCRCNTGYNNAAEDVYHCELIVCPTTQLKNAGYCKWQCESHCKNGICSLDGTCHCLSGFQSTADDRFSCNQVA